MSFVLLWELEACVCGSKGMALDGNAAETLWFCLKETSVDACLKDLRFCAEKIKINGHVWHAVGQFMSCVCLCCCDWFNPDSDI